MSKQGREACKLIRVSCKVIERRKKKKKQATDDYIDDSRADFSFRLFRVELATTGNGKRFPSLAFVADRTSLFGGDLLKMPLSFAVSQYHFPRLENGCSLIYQRRKLAKIHS